MKKLIYGIKVIAFLCFIYFFTKMSVYGEELHSGRYLYITEGDTTFYDSNSTMVYVPYTASDEIPTMKVTYPINGISKIPVYCLNPGLTAPSDNTWVRQGMSSGSHYASSLIPGLLEDNGIQGVAYDGNTGAYISDIASEVMGNLLRNSAGNGPQYVVEQLVLWRVNAKFVKFSKGNGGNDTNIGALKNAIKFDENDKDKIKSHLRSIGYGAYEDYVNALSNNLNMYINDICGRVSNGNVQTKDTTDMVAFYYPDASGKRDIHTQLLIGYPKDPNDPPPPPPAPSPTYYNVKISRYYQDSSGNNVWTFTDRNGSYEKGTTISYDVPDYDIINTITGIGMSNRLNFTVNGNVDIKIYYRVGRIKIINYVTNELNETSNTDMGFLKFSDGSTAYLYGSASVNLGGEYKGYKYKGVSWSGNTRNWNTTSIQIGRSKNDVTVKVYYGLRHIYIGYFNKNGDSITPMKDISKRTYPGSGSFSDDIKITSSSNSTIYSNNNKYVYTNSGIYSGASNSPQAIFTTNIRNENRWKWYSDINNKLKYSDVYNTAYIKDQDKKPKNFSGDGITIKGLTTSYDKIPANSSFSIHFYYKIEKPMKVYIRHYVDNVLDNTIANNEEVWYNSELSYNHGNDILSSTEWYKVSNGFNQRKFGTTSNWNNSKDTVDTSKYSEMYTLDKKDWLMVDRSRTIIKDGYIYKCTKCKKKTYIGTQQENDWTYQSNTKLSIHSTKEGKDSEDTYSVYIDYFYEKVPYSNDNPGGDSSYKVDGKKTTDISDTIIGTNAKLKFTPKTKNTSGTYNAIGGINGNVAYVPVLENLKPYIETSICMPRNLVYKIEKVSTESKNNSNGTVSKSAKVTYGIEKYTALGIKLDNSANVFDITGNGNDKVYSNVGISTPIKSENNNLKTKIEDTKNTLLGVNASNIFSGPINKNGDVIFSALKQVTDNTKTNESYFKDDSMYDIKESKYNGMREPTGVAFYVEYDLINNTTRSKIYSSKISNENSMDVNIYTPMQVDSADIQTVNFVNHSNNTNAHIIQKGAEFTLKPKINESYKGGCYNSNLPEITKYLQGYYVIFGFKIKRSSDGREFDAGTPIWIPKNGYITATPTAYEGEEAIKQLHETIQVIAVTKNASEDLRLKAYGTTNGIGDKDKAKNVPINLGIGALPSKTSTVTDKESNKYEVYDINMNYDSHYFVKRDTVTTTIARLYDFKITDCYDIDFKNVFRKSGNNNVNSATGIQYFSGIKALNIYTKGYNDIVNRTGINISNSNSKLILPLGPYKNTNTSYVKAPKLGYRISFDVKTYGYYNYTPGNNSNMIRTVNIEPKYYYISKDGSKIIDKVKLYYKNPQGKYVTFEQSSYNISFKPNDGYRFIQNLIATDDLSNMSDKLIDLNVGKSFTLDNRMMSTSNDKFVQAWYGEYKVPSSTIVVDNSSGTINLNKPLTDGYLGVKFIIKCIDKDPQNNSTVEVIYSNQDQKASGVNTTQWDYEGYLGYNGNGNEISSSSPLKLQLEKGTLNVDQSSYEKIKGTVVLYDIDNRAASDFD